MARILSVREIINDDKCPYKAAFDVKLGTVHYFSLSSKNEFLDLTNEETADELKYKLLDQESPISLNRNSFYVRNNLFAQGKD